MDLNTRLAQLAKYQLPMSTTNISIELKSGELPVHITQPSIIARYGAGEGIEFVDGIWDMVDTDEKSPLFKILVDELGDEQHARYESILPGMIKTEPKRAILIERHVILDMKTKLKYEFFLPSRKYLKYLKPENL